MTQLSGLETTPEVGDEKLGPAGAATLIADFVDVLIPGERLWPSASTVGVQGQLALRLMEERGKNALPTLVKAIEVGGRPARRARRGCARRGRAALRGGRARAFWLGQGRGLYRLLRESLRRRGDRSHGSSLRVAPALKGYPVQALRSGARHAAITGAGATRRQRTSAASTSAASTSRAIEPKPGA